MLMDYIRRISFFKHLLIALGIRLVLVSYSEIHDQNAEVLYTDVDYEVVTDGARHILENRSPFQRHTFRYSPILALILTPNVYHKSFGKILFSLFDIVWE
uniref:GPI alpha-1,4-mannosyltransferase I, catalytic subunit n=1 Tax=Megaselia scalaris TaxID=36166 RepID=T1GIU9_MEGSC